MATQNVNILLRMRSDLKGMREAQKQARELRVNMMKFAQLGAVFSGVQLGVQGLVSSMNRVVRAGINFNANLEQQTVALASLMGNAEAARDRIQELVRFAAQTPFQMSGIVQANRYLQTFGGRTLATTETLKLVGDAAAASGRQIEEVAMWVGRLYSGLQNGQPVGEATMRLLEMGVISGDLKAQLDQLATSGTGGAGTMDTLREAFGGVSGAMLEQSRTFSGLVSTLQDNLQIAYAAASEPVFEELKVQLQETLEAMGDGRGLRTFGVMMADLTGVVLEVVRAIASVGRELVTLGMVWAASRVGSLAGSFGEIARTAFLAARNVTTINAAILAGRASAWRPGIASANQYTASINAATGALARFRIGVVATGRAMRAAFLANPIGLAVTALLTAGTLVWQWVAGQRSVRREVEQTAAATKRLQDAWPERIAQVEDEAAQTSLVRDLNEQINLLIQQRSQGGLNVEQERQLSILRQQVNQAEALTELDRQRNREMATRRRAQEQALRSVNENLAKLEQAPDELGQLQAKLELLPEMDPATLRATRERLMAELERGPSPMEVLAGVAERAPTSDPTEQFKAVAEVRQQWIEVREQELAQNAVAIQQAAERAELERRIEEITSSQQQEVTELREKLRDLTEAEDQRLARLKEEIVADKQRLQELTNGSREYLQVAIRIAQNEAEVGRMEKERTRAEIDRLQEKVELQAENTSALRETLRVERELATQRGDHAAVQDALEQEETAILTLAAAYEDLAAAMQSADPQAAADARNRAASLRGQARTLGPDQPRGIGEGVSHGVNNFLGGSMGEAMGNRAVENVTQVANTMVDSIGGALEGLINKTMSWGEALRSVAASFGQSMLRAITDITAYWVVQATLRWAKENALMLKSFALRQALGAKELAANVARAAASFIAWLPSALAASISSFGAAAAVGAAALAGVVAAAGGFASGGFTGDGPRDEPAGVVHKGEWVAPKWMVRDPQLGATIAQLEAQRRGSRINYSRGYAVGGPVDTSLATPGQGAGAAESRPIRLALVDTRKEAERLKADPDFETLVVDIGRRNRGEILQG